MGLEESETLQGHAGVLRWMADQRNSMAVFLLYQIKKEARGKALEGYFKAVDSGYADGIGLLCNILGSAEEEVGVACGEVGVSDKGSRAVSWTGDGQKIQEIRWP
ncbi:unnamed protein product [marine sediment metagenome]|uniref:Uncharacterized protein n=1 Tax=marine sediment metagenome TaxID=412755 RepID=X1G840_9ZZZZ